MSGAYTITTGLKLWLRISYPVESGSHKNATSRLRGQIDVLRAFLFRYGSKPSKVSPSAPSALKKRNNDIINFIDTADLSRGAQRRWRFFALFAKNTTSSPLDRSGIDDKKISYGVALCALSESNPIAMFLLILSCSADGWAKHI